VRGHNASARGLAIANVPPATWTRPCTAVAGAVRRPRHQLARRLRAASDRDTARQSPALGAPRRRLRARHCAGLSEELGRWEAAKGVTAGRRLHKVAVAVVTRPGLGWQRQPEVAHE